MNPSVQKVIDEMDLGLAKLEHRLSAGGFRDLALTQRTE